jgi:uncharacterized membrane protein required for colicin V production
MQCGFHLALAGLPRHNKRVFGQHPGNEPAATVAPTAELLQHLQAIGWVDRTAVAVLLVFFAIGVFQGLIWQVSRVGILVAAYVLSGRYGQQVASWLTQEQPMPAAAVPPEAPGTTLYLAYVLVFLVVLVALSLLAIALQRAVKRVGLGFFDRLGGGIAGVAAGAGVVLFGLFVVHMFFQGSELAAAAKSSHSLRLCKRAIDLLGPSVPDDLREVIALVPLRSAGVPPRSAAEPVPAVPAPPAEPVPATWPPPPARDQRLR